MWLTFLTRHDLLKADKLPKELDNDKLKKALKVLDVLNFSEEERELYEDHLKWLRIEANTLKKTAEKAKEEGIAEGIEKGIEKRNIEVAINMIKQKLDNKLISSVTGLTLEEILKLKNKN
jgi:predicted transposase/invertase (TIGR01784 family)